MADQRDLSASLADMDRRLRELQRDLAEASAPSEPPAPPPPPPVDVVDEAEARVAELGRRIDDLQRLREELVDALQDESQNAKPSASDFSQRAAGGEVVVDAGPFTSVSALSAFERALNQLPQVEEAWVRSLEDDRARIDVRLVPGEG